MTIPVYFRDVKQAIFAGKNLNKRPEWHNGFYSTFIDFALFRNGNNAPYFSQYFINRILVCRGNFDDTKFAVLGNGNSRAGLSLHLLNNLSARSYNSTDEFSWNINLDNSWSKWLVIFARSRKRF